MSDIENRHIFAVITARASASEQKQVLDGIISEGLKMNTDIVVISNIYNASQYNDFITLEDNIYSLINSELPEGFIITGDAFINKDLLEKVFSYVDEHNIPVVYSGNVTASYQSADTCTVSDFEQLTDHLINMHHFSDIDILTGPSELSTSHERVKGYRTSMQKHGLHTDDRNIIYGDFWTSSGENTALSYIHGERRMPQAVICANDYMAYAMCDTFVAHGVRIPDDITVVGYEYIGGRTDHYPILTTYERNRRALGKKLFHMLYERVTGKCSGNHISVEGKMIIGDSCPCGSDYSVLSSEITEHQQQQFFSSFNDTGMLEQVLTNSRTISDLINELKSHSYFLPDVSAMYMCLKEDWCISPEIKNRNMSSDMICYSIIDMFNNNVASVHFSITELLPAFIRTDHTPNAYFCFPLFFMDRDLGFMIFRYDSVTNPGNSSVSWVKIISNALEFLRMKNDIDYLMQCRNLSELHDSATGLYNQTGFINELGICIRNSANTSDMVILMLRFNSESKTVDSEYIFEKTSFLTDTAEVFRSFAGSHGKICGRIEKDVFAIAVTDYNGCPQYEQQITERIETLLYGCFIKHRIYGPDFVTVVTMSGKITENQCSQILNDLYIRSGSKLSVINSLSYSPDYVKYCTLRKRNYIGPYDIPDSSQACRQFYLSSGHFCAVYKSLFKISYHQDSIIMRIRLAKYLLVSSSISIASIAEKCGYNNEKYFMQQFRLITGMTPNMYRKLKI